MNGLRQLLLMEDGQQTRNYRGTLNWKEKGGYCSKKLIHRFVFDFNLKEALKKKEQKLFKVTF